MKEPLTLSLKRPFVLGLGLPRTGSVSMKLALETLLGTKCYHMMEICGPDVIGSRNWHARFWDSALDGNKSGSDIIHFLLSNGYGAALDLPLNCFWKEVYENLPNAKVILTVREPQSWYQSLRGTINNPVNKKLHSFPYKFVLDAAGYLCNLKMAERSKNAIGVGFNDIKNEEEAERFVSNWNQNVIDTVKPENLLIYKSGEGWKPICDFLEVPIPEESFPKLNSFDELNSIFDEWFKFCKKTLIIVTVLITILLVSFLSMSCCLF